MTSAKDASPIAINRPLWLASGSPRRRDLLAQIGYRADAVIAPEIDETVRAREVPRAYTRRVARAKAEAVRARQPKPDDAVIIAADTAVCVGRRILPKAESESEARACLALLSGRGHRVYTGLCVLDGAARIIERQIVSRLRFKYLDADEITRYLASGEWRGKAGGYAIQGAAAAFSDHMIGSYSNIVGLPLFEISNILRGIGVLPNWER